VRARLRSEAGIALPFALVTMLATGTLASSAIAYSSWNYGSTKRSDAESQAFALAEAGINNAMAILANPSNDPTNPSLLPGHSQAYEGGTATWSGTYNAATSTWTLIATGEMRNPTGPSAAPVRRTITSRVPVGSAPVQQLQNESWNYMVSTRTGFACDQTMASSVVNGAPVYTFGNLCLSAASVVTRGPLAVRGSLTISTGASVGTLASPVSEAHVAGGCAGHPCSAADNVFAARTSTSPPLLTAPTPNWDHWYANAAPGPARACETSSGTVPVFDNNGARDRSVTTVFSLTPASSYTCRVGPPGNPSGELSWNASTRVLTVRGTIFIDGQAKVDNGQLNTYEGQGVLYLSGSFAVQNGSKLCAVAAVGECDFTNWDSNSKLFAVVTNGNGGIVLPGYSVLIGCYDRFQGAIFATNAVQFSSGAKHQGPIVASAFNLGSTVEVKPLGRLTRVPAGLPGQTPSGGAPQGPRDFSG
jgi:hypothetical protein